MKSAIRPPEGVDDQAEEGVDVPANNDTPRVLITTFAIFGASGPRGERRWG